MTTYTPIVAVWEITSACNLQCRHCGSACSKYSSGDLDTTQTLALCEDLAALGLKFITLSGGEPLLRKDWHIIARHLVGLGITVNLITNGWLINERIVDLALNSSVANIGISLDGPQWTHDYIRGNGAFSRAVSALEAMQQAGLESSVITTVTRWNISQLSQIKEYLEDKGVKYWQFQLGLPMGNLGLYRESIVKPEQIIDIIEFACDLIETSSIIPYVTDCIGYFTNNWAELRMLARGSNHLWNGCQAGKSGLGILHDGSIVGCTSIRDRRFIEGNVLVTPLAEIWNRHGAFSWNRGFRQEFLSGFCRKCRFATQCLGGCSNLKLTMTGAISENPYCAYRVHIEELTPNIIQTRNLDVLLARAVQAVKHGLFEVAEMCLTHALCLEPLNMEVLKLLGYVAFKTGDFKQSRNCNELLVAVNSEDA